jgi:geranylgeranyl pyrophosphate synthase
MLDYMLGHKQPHGYLAKLTSINEVTLPTARRMMEKHASDLPSISDIFLRALCDESPSEYPFVFSIAYELNGKTFVRVAKIAAAIHLLQTSTFVFDDILDMSGKRARAKTIYSEWGTETAIVAGELLQSVAMSEVASESARLALPNAMSGLRILALALADVYKGQYLDMLHSGDPAMALKLYHRIIFLTTGQFLGRVALVGALLSGISAAEREPLRSFGENYGMALQVFDDIVDVTLGQKHTGKDYGADIRKRRMRLPLIIALRNATAGERLVLREYLANSSVPEMHEVRMIARLIKNVRAIEYCRKAMMGYVEKALGSLQRLPEGSSRRYLAELAIHLENDLDGV